MTKAEYLNKVNKIQDYIKAGDIYQANLTRKFYGEFSVSVDPFNIYCELNRISPAPYSAFLKINDLFIISSSPELFIRVDNDGNAITCPIKGSAAKGQGKELSLSEKDRSENLMITDLMRNDFSRSCIPGSVKVENLFEVSEFENISHMYSTITGKLADKHNSIELIKNCFPPGSMTGTPKIHAIEICSELEKHKRGVYSGALGYFNLAPDAKTISEFSVVIRTILIQGNKFEFQVGGGIVYDSQPEKEWQETMLKAQAISEVLGISNEIKAI
jgi:para-aminobenzoate synthetase component 1